ncbi:hypothetical protein IV80_GL000108 [Pediococcus cellicola]|uniref:Diacylglycerol kinase n=2 Tax=Pediococcus cellicola TaxID=319652 RepID=A0A0R2IRC4_9LACO|nr:hypothetical protein IV80_GL000108 [Pediococcus cellicola]
MALKDKKQIQKNHSFKQSFTHACFGIYRIFKEERNMRIHTSIAVLVIFVGWLLQITSSEWYWVMACIGWVFVAEVLNTIAENIVDLVTGKTYSELGKHIKDMAAGAVLISACFAGIIGLWIFLPKIWLLLIH